MEIQIQTQFVEMELTVEELHRVPERSGCYLLYGSRNELLYIGKTTSFPARMRQHLNGNTNTEIFHKKIRRMKFLLIPDEADMSLYEVYLINKLKPKYNKAKVYYKEGSAAKIPVKKKKEEYVLDLQTLHYLYSYTSEYVKQYWINDAKRKYRPYVHITEVENYLREQGLHVPKFHLSTGKIRPEIKQFFAKKGMTVQSNGITPTKQWIEIIYL